MVEKTMRNKIKMNKRANVKFSLLPKIGMDKRANVKFSLLSCIRKDKKADLPVTILTIGVFVVCTLALLSFMYSTYKLNKSFDGVNLMEEANARIEMEGLNSFYIDKKVNQFSPGFGGEEGFHLFQEKIVFSVEYNP